MSYTLVLTLMLAGPARLVPAQAPAELLRQRADSLFGRYDRCRCPGAAVGVVQDGRVLFRRGYGLANLEDSIPITPATVFDVASVSKQFTGLAIAMLAEQGKLDLDADVRTWIPELGIPGATITVDQLVHHSSGLRDWPGTLAVAGWRLDDIISFEQILAMAFAQRSLNFKPGAEHLYSNTGYNLLAELVTRIERTPFADWMEQRVFRPLGMTSSRFRDDVTRVFPNRAHGYTPGGDGRGRLAANGLTAQGSSSLFSTVDDLLRWLTNFDTRAVGGAAIERMRTTGRLNDGSEVVYAYGISRGQLRGLTTWSHSGSWASFSTFVLHIPAERIGVVVLANTAINTSRAAHDLAEALLGPAAVVPASDLPAPPAVPARLLAEYEGLYRLGPGWYVRITRQDDGLRTQATGESAFPMTPRSEREFWVEGYQAMMRFGRDSAGRVSRLDYREIRAPRLLPGRPPTRGELAALVGEYWSAELETGYRVELADSGLQVRHPRHGRMPLTWLHGNDFRGSAWFLRSVEFTRDSLGGGTSFAVSGARYREIRFVRRVSPSIRTGP
jgi:CubicO group peptidase (beta-lactamase class C family)